MLLLATAANAASGTYAGSPTLGVANKWASGDTAVTFNGSNQYVTLVALPSGINFSGGVTIECWAKPTALTAYGGIVDMRTTGANNFVNKICFDLGSAGTGVMRAEIYDANGSSGSGGFIEAADTTNAVFVTGAWHHYAMVVKADKSVSFYKDGTAYAGSASFGVLPPAGVSRT